MTTTTTTTTTTSSTPARAGAAHWHASMERILQWAPLAGPAIMIGAALFVTFQIQMLPGDLDWISEPEGLIGMLAAPFLVATWIVVGRRLSEGAPRTGVVVTLLGTLAATSFVNPMASRLLSVDLVEKGADPTFVNDTWDAPTVWSGLSVILIFTLFLVPLIAGVAILKTGTVPRWTGVAFIAFVPVFIAAQAAYAAMEVTWPLAWVVLLAAVFGVTRADSADVPRSG